MTARDRLHRVFYVHCRERAEREASPTFPIIGDTLARRPPIQLWTAMIYGRTVACFSSQPMVAPGSASMVRR